MSSFEQSPGFEPRPEALSYQELVLYLQGQVQDAFSKEYSEQGRGHPVLNGSFYQYEFRESEHALIHDSVKVIMKPPHPYDEPGRYAEVFAMIIDQEKRELEEKLEIAQMSEYFLIRLFKKDKPGDFWFLDETGLHSMKMDRADLPKWMRLFNRIEDATEVMNFLLGANIVAVAP